MDYTTRNWLDKYVMRFLSMMDTISHAKKVEAEAKKIEAEAKMMIAKAQWLAPANRSQKIYLTASPEAR